MTKNWPICLLAPLLLIGCVSSKIQQGGTPGAGRQAASIYLAPYHNATPNPTAGRALTDITATSLLAHGLPLVQSESANAQAAQLLEEGKQHQMLAVAKSVNASHALLCSVHEYRFKSDLDGAPTVGLTMRLVDTFSGQTVWQGTGSRAGSYYGSLSKTAQTTINELVREMSGRSSRRSTQPNNLAYQPASAPAPQPVATYSSSSTRVETASPPAAAPAPGAWDASISTGPVVPAEPEYEQIRRRTPKTQPVTAFPTNSAAMPVHQPAPQRGRYDPIYTPPQSQPVWTTHTN